MTSREREVAVVRHEPTGRVLLDAICIEIIPGIAARPGIDDWRLPADHAGEGCHALNNRRGPR
jgi:hypothetical protein